MNTEISQNIKPILEDVIASALKIPRQSIHNDLEYQSIVEWDSLGHITLMIAIEEAFERVIDSDTVLELTSVEKIKNFLLGQNQLKVIKENQDSTDRVHRGLRGVYFDWTKVSHVDGKSGQLLYRGYSIDDLVEHSTFEEVAHLLIYGFFPDGEERKQFERKIRESRSLPLPVLTLIGMIKDSHPMDVLRTSISALSAFDPDRNNHSLEGLISKGIRLIAQIPVIIATHYRMSRGLKLFESLPELPHVSNFIYIFSGKHPTEVIRKIWDRDLILHADNGANASTFAARVTTGTRADFHAAITAAIATFSGPLHGGAAEEVMKMLQEIGSPENAHTYIQRKLQRNEAIPGFGHRVYRVEDPRIKHLRCAAEELCHPAHDSNYLSIIDSLVKAMKEYQDHGIALNVDMYTGVTYHQSGIPEEYVAPIFVMSRIVGWVAQVIEQSQNNILIRPLLKYAGQKNLKYFNARKCS